MLTLGYSKNPKLTKVQGWVHGAGPYPAIPCRALGHTLPPQAGMAVVKYLMVQGSRSLEWEAREKEVPI